MPRLSLWFTRASLIYLMIGFTLGAAMLADRGAAFGDPSPALWRWRAGHVEMLMFGWVVQLVMGVALWIFPRFGVHRSWWTLPSGWVALVSLNLGVLCVTLGPVLAAPSDSDLFVTTGRVLEIAAALAFASGLWPRVRASLSEM